MIYCGFGVNSRLFNHIICQVYLTLINLWLRSLYLRSSVCYQFNDWSFLCSNNWSFNITIWNMKTTYVHLNTQLYDLKSKSRTHCWRHEIVQHFNVQQTEHDLDWSGPDALHCLKTWYHRKCNSRTHFRHCKIAKRFRQHINKKRRWNDCWLLRCTNLEGGFLSEQLSVWKFFLFQLEIHGAFQKMYLDRSSPKKTFMCFFFWS